MAVGFSDLSRVGTPLLAVVGERDTSVAQAALAASIGEAGGQMEIIAGADASFQESLPNMGKSVVRWLTQLGSR